MASAGTVTVDFAAETARFTAELRKVNASIDGLGAQFDSVGKIARNLFAAVSFTAITSQLQSLISSSLELGGAIADATKKAGVSAEAFSELNFAAKLAGVGTDDLSDAFSKFQKELAGGGDKIASLGINLQEFRKLQPDRQFEVLAEAISQIKDPAVRAGAAIEIFGKSGANLLPLFEDGAKGIRSAREEAQRLGITLTTDQANALDAAGDRVDALKARASNLALIFTSELAPSIEFVTKKLQELLAPKTDSQKELSTLTDQFDTEVKRRRNLIQELTQLRQRKETTFVPGLDAEFDIAIAEAQQKIRVTDNLLNFLSNKIQKFNIDAEIAKQKAEAPIAPGLVDPSKATFGDPSAKAQAEALKKNKELNLALREQFFEDQLDLNKIISEMAQQGFDNLAANEAKKTKVVEDELQKRADAELKVREFSDRLSEEQARNEAILREQATDNIIANFATLASFEKKHSAFRKAVQVAEAIRNVYVGITRALDYPYPLNIIAAASTAAVGFKAVTSLNSTPDIGVGGGQSFSAGGSGVTIGTAPTNPVNQPPAQQIQAQPTVTQVVFSGPVFNTEETQQLIVDAVREATDRDVIVITPRSAQAQQFMAA